MSKSNKYYSQFFNRVMIDLRHHGWKMRICEDNYCWISHKRIDIDLTCKGDPRQIILHEIAHIDTAKYCNQKHNPDFWKRLEDLTRKYLNIDLDKHQKKHKEFMTNGIYAMCYVLINPVFDSPISFL